MSVVRVRRWGCLVALVLGLSGASLRVSAQDDWSLSREPSVERRVKPRAKPANAAAKPVVENARTADPVERAYRALLNDPDDAFALSRVRELWLSREGSLDGLVKKLAEERVLVPSRIEPALAQAEVLALMEKGEQALALLSELPSDEPRVLFRRARVLKNLGRKAEARGVYEELQKSGKQPSDRRAAGLALAELALDSGDFDGARAQYAAADAKDAQNPALYEFASALSARGEHARAARVLRELAETRRADARAYARYLREAARAFLAARDDAASIEAFQGALRVSRSPSERAEIYDGLIEAHRRSNQLAELATSLEQDRLGGAEAIGRAALLWDELADEKKAVAAYRKALALAPRDLDLRRGLSQLYLRAGKLDESIAEQEALAALAPDDPAVVVSLAKLLREVGRADDALTVLERAARAAPRSLMLHRALAELYALWGDSTRAQAELSLLARLDPDDPTHIVALGSERFERGDREGALSVWNRLLERSGGTADAESELAMVLADHDLLELALTHAQKAAELDPQSPERARDVAVLLERAGRFEQAEGAFRLLLLNAKADELLHREARQHLVGLWTRNGALRARVIDLEDRFRREPKDIASGKLLAEAYARDPSDRVARDEQRVLEKLVLLDPKDAESLRALERACTRRGDVERALQVIELLVAAQPAQASSTLKRAVELALSSYRDADALRFARRAVEISPRDARAHKLLGDLERKRSKLDLALTSYERSLELDRKDYDTTLAVAQLRLARGEHALAEQRLFDVLDGAVDDELVRRAATILLELSVAEDRMNTVEPKLLELALDRPERPLFRKLLIDAYAAWLVPLLQKEGGGASERAELSRMGQRALKPLLEALSDKDASQRTVALSLLGRIQNPAAAAPLLAVAENSPRTEERAAALIAVGELRAADSAARLRVLLAGLEGRLRPIALWALLRTAREAAYGDLLALASDRDGAVRTIVALGLGATGSANDLPLLKKFASERNANVRAAALLALAWLSDTSLLSNTELSPAPVWQVSSRIQAGRPESLENVLFAPDPEQREWALSQFGSALPSRAIDTLPVPRWPFHARDYVLATLAPSAAEASFEPSAELLAALEAALVTRLRGAEEHVLVALSVLESLERARDPGGEAPASACEPVFLQRPRLVSVLEELGDRGIGEGRRRALSLLVRAGHSASEAVLNALDRGPPDARNAVLEALADRAEHPGSVRTRLLTLARTAPEWPTRLRAVRALSESAKELEQVLNDEPYAIVRDASVVLPNAKRACRTGERDSVN